MIALKSLSLSAVPHALEKAERYRLLNQPWAAESICLDILQVDPGNQEALRMLLLARTDQFGVESASLAARARETLAKLTSPYEQAYYAGIICERLARAHLDKHTPGAGHIAFAQLKEAMEHYERAEPLRPAGDDDSILRWNSCARLLNASPNLGPRHHEPEEMVTGE